MAQKYNKHNIVTFNQYFSQNQTYAPTNHSNYVLTIAVVSRQIDKLSVLKDSTFSQLQVTTCVCVLTLALDHRVGCWSAAVADVLAVEVVVRQPVKVFLVAAADQVTARHDAFLHVTFAAIFHTTKTTTDWATFFKI